ncbi:N-formyl-4-amino-5-aminomethyl-2-methylpyrimidine deformylase [Sporomusa carbonis]|uniref:ArgE/DapE family deacylase n=1 Tax=Sporomusa carbonis TaxID=3076075 RepID=UPI003A73DE46
MERQKMKKRIAEKIAQERDALICFLQTVIRADTQVVGHGITGGNEANGQKIIAAKLREMGCDPDIFEPDDVRLAKYGQGNQGHNYQNRPNVVGVFKGTGGGRSLILNGHVDTMPYGERAAWQMDPLGAEIKDGKLYGVGAADMKAGLVANLLAVEILQKLGIALKGDLIFQSVVDEEGGGNGTLACVERGYRADAAVVSEPTDLRIFPAHMGFIFYAVTVRGKSLHSSAKWLGVNAIEKAMLLMQALHELEHRWLLTKKHPLLPGPTINVGEISGGTAGSTVPDQCQFKFCLHYLPTDSDRTGGGSLVEKEVLDALTAKCRGDEWLSGHPPEIVKYQEGSPFEIPSDHPLVQTAAAAYSQVFASPAKVEGMLAGCDARHFANLAGMPVIVFGPAEAAQAHSTNEYVRIEDYIQYIEVLCGLITDWCGVAE